MSSNSNNVVQIITVIGFRLDKQIFIDQVENPDLLFPKVID